MPAAGVSHEPHGLVDPDTNKWSRAGALEAAPGQTGDLRPTAAVTRISCVPYCPGADSNAISRREGTGLGRLCSSHSSEGCGCGKGRAFSLRQPVWLGRCVA